MRTRLPRNIAASVRDRLLGRSRMTGEDFQFLLQRYTAERFLHQLGVSPHRDRYVLKGAMLFALWGGAIYRATRDLDFTGYGSSDATAVLAAMREVCAVSVPDDGLAFDAATLTAEPIRDNAEYNGLRLRIQAMLGVARIPMQIDIGFGNAIEPPATEADYPTLLDMPAPRVRTYPREAVVAEKLHAVLVLGERNSRYKDFYDLYVFARQFSFEGERLKTAISATFQRRHTAVEPVLPTALAPRFYTAGERARQWRAYLTRSRLPGAPADWAAVGELLQQFLPPPWRAVADGRAFSDTWWPGGPWTASVIQGAAITESVQCTLRQFAPYRIYKNSGVEWLGEIPAHWEVRRLKQLAEINSKSLPEDSDPSREMVYVDIGGVDNLGRIVEREELTFASAPSRARRIVREGDVIISTVRTYLRAIASVSNPEPGMVVSTGFAVVRPRDGLAPDYAAYALRAPYFVERVVANSKGASYPAMNEGEMATYELALPPEREQPTIAAFLNRKTAKIDALVAKKEQLIALLQERRMAFVTGTVTKGLDPHAPMKDSGVEWLGQIPAHWKIMRLTYLTLNVNSGIQMGPFGSMLKELLFSDTGYKLYGQENTISGDFRTGSRWLSEQQYCDLKIYRLKPGDIVLTRKGSIGNARLLPNDLVPGVINSDTIRLRVRSRND